MAKCRCPRCVKLIVVVVLALLGFTGTFFIFFGGVHSHLVSQAEAQTDGVATILKDFIRCDDVAKSGPGGQTDGLYTFLMAECAGNHAKLLILGAFAGTFTLFAMLSALVSNCREVKGNQYCFSVLSGVSLSLLVVAVATMTAVVWPAAKNFAPCTALGLTDVEKTFIQRSGALCVDGPAPNATAKAWLRSIALFYIGCGTCMFCLVVFLMLNACCTRKTQDTAERVPLNNNKQARGYNSERQY